MKDTKVIRGQVRQITKEILPEVLTEQMVESLRKELTLRLEQRLDDITKYIKGRLDSIENQQKDIHSYMIRNGTLQNKP